MIKKLLWIFLGIFFSGNGMAQVLFMGADINDCKGAATLTNNQITNLNFTGEAGTHNELKNYSEKLGFTESNSLWFQFENVYNGVLEIECGKYNLDLDYAVFITEKEDDCSAFDNEEALLIQQGAIPANIQSQRLDRIQYNKNKRVYICINSTGKGTEKLGVQLYFEEVINEEDAQGLMEMHDLRISSKDQPFYVKIRDAKTKAPVVSKVIVSEARSNNALYTASDFIFTYSENLKMNIEVDANGYFSQDISINSKKQKGTEIVIYLQALEQNQLIELEGLVFESQSDVLIDSAEERLKRLRDFMMTNPDIKIEIQGHVHLLGKNTAAAKSLSKKRANTVRKYLIKNGVDKKRLSVVGYGNAKMKYPEAATDWEIQANRRVEIKIK